MGLAVMIGIFLSAQSMLKLWEISSVMPSGFVLGYASSITPSQTVELTNSRRAAAGLGPLSVNAALTQAAVSKANHMFANDYWAHIAPDGTSPWTFIRSAGYAYSVAGENLARDFNDTGTMMEAWMNSPTHKENIVNSKYTEIGIAVVDGKLQGVETTLVVQMFGARSVAAARTTEKAATSTKPAPAATLAPRPTTAPLPSEVPAPTTAPEAAPTAEPQTIGALDIPVSSMGVSLTSKRSDGSVAGIISPLMITKSIAAAIMLLLISVLLYDLFVGSRKKLPRSGGKNWAHITFFAVAIVAILALTQGRII
jgi:hypothetical protein